MRQWVLDAERILDGSLTQVGEVGSLATVGERLDAWRWQLAEQMSDDRLSEQEQHAARLDRARWRELRREAKAAQSEQLKRFRFRHKREAYLASLEERWAAVSPPRPLP